MNNGLEALKIYQKCIDLMYYMYNITNKYPKHEKLALTSDIKNHTTIIMKNIILAQKEYDKKIRLEYLNIIDSELKLIKVLVRISYKFKYISSKNYGAWSRKITDVSNLLYGWIKKCQKL